MQLGAKVKARRFKCEQRAAAAAGQERISFAVVHDGRALLGGRRELSARRM